MFKEIIHTTFALSIGMLPILSEAKEEKAKDNNHASVGSPQKNETTIEIKSPRNGWRRTDSADPAGYLQEIHYPAASVSVNDSSGRQKFKDSAKIEGRIKSLLTDAKLDEAKRAKRAKNTALIDNSDAMVDDLAGSAKKSPQPKPYLLIVNGVNMPLEVREDGSFARPYAFGKGSNGVEIRTPDRKVVKRVQFYDGNSQKTQAKLRVVLSWDSPGTDLDLHVVSPDGQHVFYANTVVPNGGAQDVDVTTGYGPEIYSNATPPHGAYHVFVNFYGEGGGGGDDNQANRGKHITLANVTLITNENTPNEKQQTFRIPMRKAGDLKHVLSFKY